MSKLTLFSPAKINLSFEVIGRLPDGYHEVDTTIQAVDLVDILSYEKTDIDRFETSCVPMDENNLIIRALTLFRKKSGIFDPVSIDLEKNIPIGAGLGGGSGNAATTLFALNALFEKPFSENELQEMGGALGADVPFFFSQGTARCQGFGEIVTETSPPNFEELLIAMPNFSLSTPEVFKHCKIGESLEPAAMRTEPRMKIFREELFARGFSRVFMTGSGSAFVCLGNGMATSNDEITFFPVKILTRKSHAWYSPAEKHFGENYAHENLR